MQIQKLGPVFDVFDSPSPQLQTVMEAGSIDVLLNETTDVMTILYVISQATEDNIELIMTILSRFGNIDKLADFISNLMKYEHTKEITKFIIAHLSRNYGDVHRQIAILDSTDSDYCHEFYRVIKGEEKVQGILDCLRSFSGTGFTLKRRDNADSRDLFEAALISSSPRKCYLPLWHSPDSTTIYPFFF